MEKEMAPNMDMRIVGLLIFFFFCNVCFADPEPSQQLFKIEGKVSVAKDKSRRPGL